MKNKIIIGVLILFTFILRTYQLENNPPGFYSDEASYAYNAYSILKTGRDEHGVFLPITAEAFGDYKLPVMLYSIVASFALFSPSEWAARLPGALYGTGTILALYYLIKELRGSNDWKIPLLAGAFLAIAPAHIFVSRGTWELTPALFFITIGTLTFTKALHSTGKAALFSIVSAVSFILALYSYNSARVFVPLFGIGLIIIFWQEIRVFMESPANRIVVASLILGAILLCLPILKSIGAPEVTQRAKYISIFYDKGVDSRLFEAIRSDSGQPVKLTQILHNKPIFYSMDFLKRYLSHFDFNFLFVIGDTFEIFRLAGLGLLPLITLPLVFIGAISLYKQNKQLFLLFTLWLVISPIASSFTVFTPSVSRAQNMIIPLVVFAAYGAAQVYREIADRLPQTKPILVPIVLVLYGLNTGYILNQYFVETPKLTAEKWNDGFKEQVAFAAGHQDQYDKILISSTQAPSYIFYAWNLRYDPATFQNEAHVDHTPDQNGLNFTSQFGKYHFTKDITGDQKKIPLEEKTLVLGFPNELVLPNKDFYSRNRQKVAEAKE